MTLKNEIHFVLIAHKVVKNNKERERSTNRNSLTTFISERTKPTMYLAVLCFFPTFLVARETCFFQRMSPVFLPFSVTHFGIVKALKFITTMLPTEK